MAQALGIVYVIWNGTKLSVERGSSFEQGGLMQKPVITGQQVDYALEMKAGRARATKRLMRGDDLLGIWTSGPGELQLQCDTGQTFVAADAFLINTANFTAGDGGKVSLEWNFGVAAELTNG
jgi:hypothetical protein